MGTVTLPPAAAGMAEGMLSRGSVALLWSIVAVAVGVEVGVQVGVGVGVRVGV